MSLDIGIDPQTSSLLTAIGLTDDDGQLVAEWFDHPMSSIRTILSDPAQRAALLRLLDDLLPPDANSPGWHPLLDTDAGNLYLTVDGDVIGVAASMRSGVLGSGIGRVSGTVRLPLIRTGAGFDAIAGTAEGPLQIGVEVGFTGADVPVTAIGAAVTVYLDDTAPLGVRAGVRVNVDGFDLGDGDPVDLVIDSGSVGADLVAALRALLRDVVDALVASAGVNVQLGRLADHLFELLGLGAGGAIPPLPVDELFERPDAAIDWLVDIVDTPATLTSWATHLAGLLGDDLAVSGAGTAASPFRAALIDSDVVDLFLRVVVTDDRDLEIGLEVDVAAGPVALSGTVTVLRIPLPTVAGAADPAAVARRTAVVPEAIVALVAPTTGLLIDDAPTLRIGRVGAGFRLAGAAIEPWLSISDVTIDGTDHGDVDLTDADAVVGVVGDAARGVIEDALGDAPAARALLTLLGLRRPDSDPATPHLLDPLDLGRGPTVALGELHRGVLADPTHPWSHMFEQVAVLVGLTPAVTGTGAVDDPWVTPIAATGPVTISLAAWNARSAADPAGLQRLRLGVAVSAVEGVFAGDLLVELLAIDLPSAGTGTVNLVGRSQLAITVTPDGPLDLSGLTISSGPVRGLVGWQPGDTPTWSVGVAGVAVTIDGQAFGPYDLALPDLRPDLGLGADAVRVLGQLISSGVRSWAGEPAYALAALVGLHRDLPDLPADWPLVAELVTDATALQDVLDDPVAVLRSHLERALTGVAADGTPHLDAFLRTLGGLLPTGDAPSFDLPSLDGPSFPSISGNGRYDDPWAITLVGGTVDASGGATGVDVLVWLDPDGPPQEWIGAVARYADDVGDGDLLVDFLGEASAFRPELATLLGGRNLDALAHGIDGLTDWITAGDGLVPLESQLPDGWIHGTTATAAHALLPTDPAVIAQVVARLAASTGPVLLVAPPFADHSVWADLIEAITGAPPVAGRHFDLRALPNPAEVDLSRVVDAATVYTADLLADHALGEAEQLRLVVERIRSLTGSTVRVVGHSTAGVVARTLAAAHPELVDSLVTLGTPHAGSDLGPLGDPAMADALRVVGSLTGSIAGTALGGTVDWLAGLADGVGNELGGPIKPGWFAGVPAGLVDTVPGFAIGSQLGGDLVGLLAGATVTELAAGAPPTHVGFGLRVHLASPRADDPVDDAPGDIGVDATARLDLARLRLVADAPEPARPATALSVSTRTSRPNGWLVGAADLPDGPIVPRVRALEAGVTVSPAASASATSPPAGATGGEVVTSGWRIAPWVRLLDASVDASRAEAAIELGHAHLRDALDAVLAELDAAVEPAAATALDLLAAAGVVFDTAEGPRASIQGLADLATVPTRALASRRDDLIAVLRDLVGDPDLTGVDLGGLDAASISIALPELPLRLTFDATANVFRLDTSADVELAGPFRLGGRLDLDVTTFVDTLDVSLYAGPVVLRRNSTRTIEVSGSPWLASPLVLRPFDPTAVTARAGDLVADLAVSALTSAVLSAKAGGGVTIPPVSALVRDPVGWLRREDVLGTAAGILDGDRVNGLLSSIARAFQLDDALGLGLPGGFLLSTSGSDPLRVELSGTFDQGSPTIIASVALGLDLRTAGPPPGRTVATPSGTVGLDLSLPGDWGRVTIVFGADAGGVGLTVTPEHVAPIQLLPSVSGLGGLLGGAVTALVPRVLQAITDELAGRPAHPVLDVALQIADALGIYDPAASGWTGSAEIERLRTMLDPRWLETQIADPANLVDLVASLFPAGPGTGAVVLPAGHRVTRVGDRLRWEMDLPGGAVLGAELGWAVAGHPQVLVTLDDLDTGPVTIVAARLGYLDDLEGLVRARVDVGEPLDWFTPEIELSVDGDRLGVRLLPLGEAAAADAEIVLVPVPGATLTPEGGIQLAGSWVVPLVTHFAVPQVESLLAQPLWTTGPSAREILHGAGLVTSATGALRIVTSFPDPAVIGMGALEVALSGVSIALGDDLTLAFAEDAGRFGIRLTGSVTFPGDVSVTLLFGKHPWIGDDAGITAWVVGPSSAPGALPVAPAPGLDAVGVGLQIAGADAAHPLFGGSDSAVQLGGVAALFFGNFSFWDPATSRATFAVDSLGAAIELSDAAVHVDGGDGDSFVAKLIPQELAAGFTTAIAYRDGRLELHGGTGGLDNGIELTFPLNLNIFDVILLRELYLAATFGQRTDVVAALSGNAELGPIAVTVTRVGLRVSITGAGAELSFKAPDGFGFSLDASTIRLGGFLLVDEAHGRYVGALELSLLDKFSLTAIGIITTKNPDGSPGFSLLMLITVTLPVPIPLGYGFFFAGAGGLLGLNRGMDVDRIRDGLRTGTADSILFPTDIINRIDVIVRDLEEAFPAQEGHFLIAPMGQITWMNPALVTLKIGLVLEIAPQPNIALLGVMRLALPTPDEAVVDLKVAFIGGIDVGAGLLYFDAAIYDSFIGYGDFKLSLEGDIAIRLSWGSNPDLVVSIGGFHPSYSPAAHLKLPAMRRLTLSLLKNNPRLTLKLYFALTSNTVQFGAQLEFYAGVSGFSISGDLGFDVLVQFVPFLIDAHMWGKLAVTAGGADICSISLDLRLRGPTPWNAHGTASFRILFIKISVDVEATFGQAHETSIPAEPVLPRVLEQFADPSNWVAELSSSASAGVTLLPLPQGGLVVDAAGMLTARQNLIPLETDIGLVGKTPPSDVKRVAVRSLTFGTGADDAADLDDVTAPFAPSTFAGASSTNPDLLKAPAFEDRPNGVRVTSGQSLEADFVLHHPQTYEMIVIDDPDPEATPQRAAVNPRLAFSRLVPGGAIGASAASRSQRKLAERGAVLAAATTQPKFAVTAKDALVALDGNGQPTGAAELLTRTEAEQRLAELPADGRRFQLVPEVQIAR